jgi:hypothetical protein
MPYRRYPVIQRVVVGWMAATDRIRRVRIAAVPWAQHELTVGPRKKFDSGRMLWCRGDSRRPGWGDY